MSCFLHALHFFLIHQPLHFPSFFPHFFHSRNVSFHPSRGICCSSHVLRVSLALPPDLSPLPVFCHRNPDISAVLKWASNLNVTRGLDRFPSTQSLKHTHTHKRGSVNVGLFLGYIGLLQPHLNSSFPLIGLSLLHSHPFSLSLWLPPFCLIISIFEMPWHFTLLISTSLYHPLLISAVWLHLSLLGGLSIQPLCSSFCWVLLSLSLSLFFSFKSYQLLSNSQQLYNLFSSTRTHTHPDILSNFNVMNFTVDHSRRLMQALGGSEQQY